MTKETKPTKLEGNELVIHNTFNSFMAELEQMEATHEAAEFNMETKKGLKEYKSFVAQMRRAKKPITEAHKAAKAEAKALCDALDGEKKSIIGRIQDMIDHHDTIIKDHEAIETNRVEALKERVEGIRKFVEMTAHMPSDEIQELIEQCKGVVIDESFEEYRGEAAIAKDETILALTNIHADVKVKENEQAELERLRKEKEESERKEREEQIARDAAEKAEREKQEAIEKAERDKQEAIDKAEREKAEAEQARIQAEQRAKEETEAAARKAEEDKQAAVEAERQRAEREKIEQERLEQERANNEAHRANVEGELTSALVSAGLTPEWCQWFITVVNSGAIPHVKIQY